MSEIEKFAYLSTIWKGYEVKRNSDATSVATETDLANVKITMNNQDNETDVCLLDNTPDFEYIVNGHVLKSWLSFKKQSECTPIILYEDEDDRKMRRAQGKKII